MVQVILCAIQHCGITEQSFLRYDVMTCCYDTCARICSFCPWQNRSFDLCPPSKYTILQSIYHLILT